MKFLVISSIAFLLTQQVIAKPAEGCLQNYTITEIDSCFSVAAQFQITEPEFYAMNPGLHHSVQHDCDNLDTGKPFCVCMKSPCPVESVSPAASSIEANATAPIANASVSATAISSSSSSLASVSGATSSVASSAAASSATASSTGKIGTSSSSSVSASAQTSTTSKSGASMTTAISAISIGLVMTATAMLF